VARILIAEDEARIASFLEKGLRANGYTTVTVDDGRTAAALARDDDFDLLVLDLGLPQMDGMEVLRHLRQRGNKMPVIILTARTEVGSTVDGFESGADDTSPSRSASRSCWLGCEPVSESSRVSRPRCDRPERSASTCAPVGRRSATGT